MAGRIVGLRSQGKTTFLHLEDGSGRIQVYLRRDQLGDAYALLEQLDLDDHLGVARRTLSDPGGRGRPFEPPALTLPGQVAAAAAPGEDPDRPRRDA